MAHQLNRKPPCHPSLLSSNDYQVYFLTQLFFQRKSDYIYISLHPLPMVTCHGRLCPWYIRCPVSLEQIIPWEEEQESPTFIKEPGQNTRKKTTDQTTQGMAAVKLLLCLLSLTASNISCFALVSFFLTTLPTKRNLFTFFDTLLVLSLTGVVNISVRIT